MTFHVHAYTALPRFIASRAVDVQYGWFSVVEPDIVCMQVSYRVTQSVQVVSELIANSKQFKTFYSTFQGS